MRIAAYARYSSDSQREASLEDQLRNCRAFCVRQGWPAPTVFTDSAISGARFDRLEYRRLLDQAAQFDVILVDDLSRFGRDKDEIGKTVKRLVFAGVRLIGVSDGVDTARKSHKADVGLRGLMSELYLDDLADKTHRGLTGRALAGASAGGLPYGYRVAGVGQRAIDPDQAAVVRRIFADYLDGLTPRAIAAGLNQDGICSARGSSWAMTAIHGDIRRGIGILANPIYVGRQIWNRSRWVKHPETGRRVRQERPESDWVTTEHPELSIVDRGTWERVQARLRGNHRDTGTGGPGRPPRHLLSGIIRCGECGAPLVVLDRYAYGCSIAKDRGTCKSKLRIPKKLIEPALLSGIQRALLSEESFRSYQRAVAALVKKAEPDLKAARKAIEDAEKIRDNVMAAIKMGIITPTTKAELVAAEGVVAVAKDRLEAIRTFQPAHFLPRARERWERIVATLSTYSRDIPAARTAIRELVGERIVIKQKASDLIAEIAGSTDASHLNVVAGAGFEPATFGL